MGIDKKCLESELGHSVLLWFYSFASKKSEVLQGFKE